MAFVCYLIDALFRWEAVTAIATVFGVGVVWMQLSAVSKQITLQNYADYTKRYQEIILNFPEDINDKDFEMAKGKKSYGQTMRYMRAYFDLCFEEWDLSRRKLIDKATWSVWEGGMHTAFQKPSFRQAWAIVKATDTQYGKEFERFVEGAMPPSIG